MVLAVLVCLASLFLSTSCTILSISFGARNIRAAFLHQKTQQPVVLTNELSSRAFQSGIFFNQSIALFDTFATEKVDWKCHFCRYIGFPEMFFLR